MTSHTPTPPDENAGDCCGGSCECTKPAGADARIAELEAAVAEAQSRYLRVMADFQNYQRRSLANENEARQQAKTAVVQGIVPVIDHFDLALSQDVPTTSAEQIVSGVRVIRDELLRVLQGLGVAVIGPAPGEEFDPSRHEAIMQKAAEGVKPGRIVSTLQAGYSLGERVIRPAKVAVAPV